MKPVVIFFFSLLSLSASGKIWIVDNNPGSTAKDFINLQAAHDGAVAGDTIYVIGSSINYISGKVTVTKRLVIMGPGYFLSENPDTQANLLSAFLDATSAQGCVEVDFAAGSQGSVMMGMEIFGGITINTDNILIKRNHFRQEPACLISMIDINGSNIFILQNFLDGTTNTAAVGLVQVNGARAGITIHNNFMFHSCAGCGGGVMALNTGSSPSDISGNIFNGGLTCSASTVQNNIFLNPNNFITPGSIVRNNIATSNMLPGGSGNINNIATALIVVNSGTTDGRWQLAGGSPALGAGFGGVDMGLYGGSEPYVLSGLPPIPTVYFLSAPSIGEKNNGLPVQIKVKSRN